MSNNEKALARDARYYRDLENVLTFMTLAESGFGVKSLSFYDGVMPGYPELMDDVIGESLRTRYSSHASRELDYDKIASDLTVVSGGMFMDGGDDNCNLILIGAQELFGFDKQRVCALNKRMILSDEAGCQIAVPFDPARRIIELNATGIRNSGEAVQFAHNYFVCRHGEWKPTSSTKIFRDGDRQFDYESLSFATGAIYSLVSLRRWRVFLGFNQQKPTVSFHTDPTGVKEFFQFRNIPEGKTRRDALLHWVSEHWRQNRHDPDVENYVREHLRGKREFGWHNLSVQIRIPQIDQDKEAALVAGRRRLKQKELDRRLKLARRGS